MSFIQSTLKCEGCGHEMNVAFGIIGTEQVWSHPTECPKCHWPKLINISHGWHANETGAIQRLIEKWKREAREHYLKARHGDHLSEMAQEREIVRSSILEYCAAELECATAQAGSKIASADPASLPSVTEEPKQQERCDLECGNRWFTGQARCRHGRTIENARLR